MSYNFRIKDQKIFAIVVFWDDYLWNQNEQEIIIFESYEDYEEAVKMWNEDQEYTGCGWHTLYKRMVK